MNTDPAIRSDWCQFRFAFQKTLDDARNTIDYHVNWANPSHNLFAEFHNGGEHPDGASPILAVAVASAPISLHREGWV
jgi:hypothetical protein